MSAAASTTQGLANLLGLYPGLEIQRVPNTTVDDERAYNKDFSVGEITSRLAAGDLPSLARQVIAHLDSNKPRLWVNGLHWLMLISCRVDAGGYASRFAREHPDEAREIVYALARRLSRMGELPEEDYMNEDESPWTLAQVMSSVLHHLVKNAVSPSTPDLQIPSSIRSGLARIMLRMQADGNSVPYYGEMDTLKTLSQAAPVKLAQWRAQFPESTAGDGHWAYWACEGLRIDASQGGTECSPPPEGYELFVCSRCLSSRYCSRAHQKADWKRHKLECFKPSW